MGRGVEQILFGDGVSPATRAAIPSGYRSLSCSGVDRGFLLAQHRWLLSEASSGSPEAAELADVIEELVRALEMGQKSIEVDPKALDRGYNWLGEGPFMWQPDGSEQASEAGEACDREDLARMLEHWLGL